MSDQANRLPQNVPGRFYVTEDCLACQACQDLAPNHFRYGDNGFSFVFKQPITAEEIKQCEEVMDYCPMEAIKDDGGTLTGRVRP